MKVFKLIFKNALRHKLRSFLTIMGIGIAVMAFGLLRTVVTTWNAGVEATAADRLITRQAVSFIFPLPYAHLNKIEKVEGVKKVTFANWFGGIYIDQSNFFARLAIDPETFFDVYPELILTKDEIEAFKKQRDAAVVGEAIANQYGLKPGNKMVLEGDIYPGRWEFTIAAIYKPRDKNTDATQMFFHWNYLNERIEAESPIRANQIGWFIVQVDDPNNSALISQKIDAHFKNSSDETKTETERAFAQGFISSTSAIITAMNVMSFAIIGIIMLVLANTMIMSARERTREYAVFKTLGFSSLHLTGLILGESLFISALGGGVGLALTFPVVSAFEQMVPKNIFPYFNLETITVVLAVSSAIFIGIISSVFPIQRALSTKIVDGFRFVG
ncbi:MAG: ABC transporter permease [Ignavibacteriaceae bacterium]|nr:ABC transporter permease [Ignavibacteriaceae bacterium]